MVGPEEMGLRLQDRGSATLVYNDDLYRAIQSVNGESKPPHLDRRLAEDPGALFLAE